MCTLDQTVVQESTTVWCNAAMRRHGRAIQPVAWFIQRVKMSIETN
jgi:hypothetical protein